MDVLEIKPEARLRSLDTCRGGTVGSGRTLKLEGGPEDDLRGDQWIL